MDAEGWAAVAAIAAGCSVLIAFWVAWYARSQARAARDSAQTALDQAASSWRAANAAEAGVELAQRSAKAAEDSAAETREANAFARQKEERERADRQAEQDEREGPVFETPFYSDFLNDTVIIDVRMVDGPDLERGEFSAIGPKVRGVSSPDGDITGAPSLAWDNVRVQDTKRARIDTNDPQDYIHATLRLRCWEKGSQRTWTRNYQIDDPF